MTEPEDIDDEPVEQERSERSDRTGFGWGLLVGMVIGAAGALVLAPRPGRETRRRIQRRLQSARRELGSRLENLEDAVRHEIRRRRRR
jgi:gas vesicle protein